MIGNPETTYYFGDYQLLILNMQNTRYKTEMITFNYGGNEWSQLNQDHGQLFIAPCFLRCPSVVFSVGLFGPSLSPRLAAVFGRVQMERSPVDHTHGRRGPRFVSTTNPEHASVRRLHQTIL